MKTVQQMKQLKDKVVSNCHNITISTNTNTINSSSNFIIRMVDFHSMTHKQLAAEVKINHQMQLVAVTSVPNVLKMAKYFARVLQVTTPFVYVNEVHI